MSQPCINPELLIISVSGVQAQGFGAREGQISVQTHPQSADSRTCLNGSKLLTRK